jgi:hypothetical protein
MPSAIAALHVIDFFASVISIGHHHHRYLIINDIIIIIKSLIDLLIVVGWIFART